MILSYESAIFRSIPASHRLFSCTSHRIALTYLASEFKTAQKQGWEKQYRYKVGKKKEYLTSSVAQEKGYERDVYKRQP